MSTEKRDLKPLFDKWRAIQDQGCSNLVTVFLSTRKPLRLNYQINTFKTEKEYAISEEEKKHLTEKLQLFHGMYATFDFTAFGTGQIGNEAFDAQLTVNCLDSADFINYAKTDRIGDGCLKGDGLLFKLHISPSMVRDILTFKSIFNNNFAAIESVASDMLLTADGDYSLSPMYGYDPSLGIDNPFLLLRLDIEIGQSFSKEAIGFSIKSLYMQ